MLTKDYEEVKQLKRTVSLACGAFGRIGATCDEHVAMSIKKSHRAIDDSFVPLMTYAIGMWSLSDTKLQKLVVVQRGMERTTLGIKLLIKKKCQSFR